MSDKEGFRVVAQLAIRMHANGSVSIEGPVDDTAWCLQLLDHARDSVKRRRAANHALIVTPSHDVALPERVAKS